MHNWSNPSQLPARKYVCGSCGNMVASDRGYFTSSHPQAHTYLCPACGVPSFFGDGKQIPGVAPGNAVAHLPADIAALYNEARTCIAASAFTSAVLACRKLLMNIAVAQGAKEGQSFLSYVEHLANAGYVPPNGRGWVDHIRAKGNEANHEIKLMSEENATELVSFSEMLLKFIYEFPNKVPSKTP